MAYFRNRAFAVVLVLLLQNFFPATAAQAEEQITIVSDEWCPYNCALSDEDEGIMVDVFREIFEKRGIRVKYEITSYKRAIDGVSKGEFDAVINVNPVEAPDLVYPEEPVVTSIYAFFVARGSAWEYTGLGSLEKVAIGVISDVSYGEVDEYIEKYKNDNTRVQYSTNEDSAGQNVDKLLKGRITATPDDKYVMIYLLKQLGYQDKVKIAGYIPHDLEQDTLYFGFSPKKPNSKKYAKIFTEEIRKMKEDGRMKAILDKYGIEEKLDNEVEG